MQGACWEPIEEGIGKYMLQRARKRKGYARRYGQQKRAGSGNPAWGATRVERNLTDGGTHAKVTGKSKRNAQRTYCVTTRRCTRDRADVLKV